MGRYDRSSGRKTRVPLFCLRKACQQHRSAWLPAPRPQYRPNESTTQSTYELGLGVDKH